MNVSIIIPIYKPNRTLLSKVIEKVKAQSFSGKLELITIDKGFGLAKSINYGIKKAKYDIIVTLHQDCLPSSKDWLKKLVEPLKSSGYVASCSSVKDIEHNQIYTPLLDEKGCAYKKKALKYIGYFDEKTFLNSGEDMDIYLKLRKIGKIAHPKTIVEHHHLGYLNAQGYKRLQNANTWGCLFRIYGFSLPGWWKAFLKANPFNFGYFYWFWKGFLNRKQDFKK